MPVKPLPFRYADTTLQLGRTPMVMGILNVTPDSFSDGCLYLDPQRAIDHGLEMIRAGVGMLDIGGESTRPGAAPVNADQEAARVVPVIRGLRSQTDIPISIDTSKAAVARQALAAGADIVNDISGLHRDPEMAGVVAESGAGCILMHMRGTPQTMQQFTDYQDLVGEICAYFADTIKMAGQAGIVPECIALDPGIGFSKTAEQNLVLMAQIPRFRALGRPVLIGHSRKSFIGKLLPGTTPADRIWGTAGATACAVLGGADILRVHDVAEMVQVATVAAAIRDAAEL